MTHSNQDLIQYVLRQGDTPLILAQRSVRLVRPCA
jgi:ring-1,2-phenylacetyl-CoA epoxidase subunit PaaC